MKNKRYPTISHEFFDHLIRFYSLLRYYSKITHYDYVQQNNNLAGETTETSHDTAKHRTNEEGIIDYEAVIRRV